MRYLLFGITICLLFTGCSATQANAYNPNPSVELQQILDDENANPKSGIAGISLTVMSPELGIDFTGAAGYDSTEKNRELDAEQPFRIASLTKGFCSNGHIAIARKRATLH